MSALDRPVVVHNVPIDGPIPIDGRSYVGVRLCDVLAALNAAQRQDLTTLVGIALFERRPCTGAPGCGKGIPEYPGADLGCLCEQDALAVVNAICGERS